jgi:CheY-like chemotaxis protein
VSTGAEHLEVLLVDDDPVVRKSYGNQVRIEGWNLTIAADGHEALIAAQDKRYDVVLLDLRTPYRNGPEVLRALRQRPETAEVAVFLLAQPGDADLVDRAMREGADGVFEKARMTPREVVFEIRAFFEAGGISQRAARQGPAPQTNVPQAVEDAARRFRKTQVSPDPRATRATRATVSGMPSSMQPSRDPAAAARAVQQRVAQREAAEGDRGPPLSTRWTQVQQQQPVEVDESPTVYDAPAPAAAPPAPAAPPGVAAGQTSYSTVLSRFLGESAKLAAALGLPSDFLCPVCGQQLALRLWPEPSMEAAVRGHFYCPRCTH